MTELGSCRHCGTLHSPVELRAGQRSFCRVCHSVLNRGVRDPVTLPLALSFAAMILLVIGMVFPMLVFEMQGRTQISHLTSGITTFWTQGYGVLAVIVALTSVIAPFGNLFCMLYTLIALRFGIRLPGDKAVFRWLTLTRPWAMLDVFLIGLLVALVKLVDLADLSLDTGFYAFFGAIILMSLANSALTPENLWPRFNPVGFTPGNMKDFAALTQAHAACTRCGHVAAKTGTCPRCGAHLRGAPRYDLNAPWAWLLAAVLCYIPANIYPIMTVTFFGKAQSDTILSGVIALAQAGEWAVAVIVFAASVLVPIAKISALGLIYFSVMCRATWSCRHRTKLFHITEAIGRWSMIDIFMVSILAALVKLDAVATIEPGIGAVAFCAVVILTMFSALSFDSRLVWSRRPVVQPKADS